MNIGKIISKLNSRRLANKLAYDDQFGGRVGEVGESREDLESRLIDLLVDPKNLVKWADDLKRLGFNA